MVQLIGILAIIVSVFPSISFSYDESYAQQCAVDLCGPAESFLPIRAKGPFENVVPENVQNILKETDVILQEMIDHSVLQKKIQADAILKLSDADLKKIDGRRLSYFKIIAALSILYPVMQKIVESTNGQDYFLSLKKAEKELPQIEKQLLGDMIEAINAFIATSGYKNSGIADSDMPMELWFRQLYKINRLEGDVEESKKSILTEYVQTLKNMREIFGEAHIEKKIIHLFEAAALGKDLSDSEKRLIMKYISRTYAMQGLLEPKVQEAFFKFNFSSKQFIELNGWNDLIDLIKSQEKLRLEKQKTIKFCHKRITQFFAAEPSPLKIKLASEWTLKVKSASKKVFKNYLSGTDAHQIESKIDDLNLTQSSAHKNYENHFKETMIRSLEDIKDSLNAIKQSKMDKDYWALLAGASTLSRAEDDSSLLNDVNEFCRSLEPSGFSDAAYSATKELRTSWQSIFFPEVGVGVVAHEIGHILSFLQGNYMLNRVGFSEVRSCSEKRHQDILRGKEFSGTYNQYQEEDWADDFSIAVINELKPSMPYLRNPYCGLLDLEKDKSKFKDLELFDLNAIDNHSKTLLRVIRAHSGMGKELPQSCKSMMGKELSEIVVRQCQKAP